jgi:putative SbcD/Mre11-related phosphoesterase
MKIRPVHPHAALLLEEEEGGKRYVAVSDLHMGLEADLGARGITVRSSMAREMLDELLSLVQSQDAGGLILLGDIKNTVSAISKQEWDDVPSFFKKLSDRADVYLVPGNHDGNIRPLVPDSVNVISSKGMVIGDTLFLHGHSMPSDTRSHVRRIVMGHLHPVFLKKGSVLNGERVWVYLQVRKEALFAESGLLDIVVVPSFNKYLYAEERRYRKSISPIVSRVVENNAVEKCMIVRLDGSIVGDMSEISSVL